MGKKKRIVNQWGYVEYVERPPRPSRAYGTGNSQPQYPNWTPPVHGTTADGQPVTASFGTGTGNDEHTLLKDGHADRDSRFSQDAEGVKQHDHYGPDANEPGGSFGTQRGKYTGYGS